MTTDQKVRTLAHLANIAAEVTAARRTLLEDLMTDPTCDMSLRALARTSGVSAAQLSRWANGHTGAPLRA